ncbi:MAG TPA: CBS domain-containing protein [Nitrospiria bacterium]|jgi:signal-transduction protein with cAMP-binding, CBS, and nucleotidyltransferase domain|nr:CBS domain-containing protein [Nitrospiria bacterium]
MDFLNMLVNKKVETIDHDAVLKAAAQRMRDRRIGSLIVTRSGQEVGIISETDLARKAVAEGLNPEKAYVSSIMSSPIISIEITESPERANDLMKDKGIRHLGITEKGKLIGIISVRDLLRYFKVYYDGIGSLKSKK